MPLFGLMKTDFEVPYRANYLDTKSSIRAIRLLWNGLFSRGLIFMHFHFKIIHGILKFMHFLI